MKPIFIAILFILPSISYAAGGAQAVTAGAATLATSVLIIKKISPEQAAKDLRDELSASQIQEVSAETEKNKSE